MRPRTPESKWLFEMGCTLIVALNAIQEAEHESERMPLDADTKRRLLNLRIDTDRLRKDLLARADGATS